MATDQISKKSTIYKQWIIGFIATILMLTHGMQGGWMSPAIVTLQSESSPSGYPLSNFEISLIASAISVLAISSAVPYGYIADTIGRRMTLFLLVIPQILGFALKLVSAQPICLIIAQAFCGIASGGVYCVVPVYIKEIAQDSLRGVLGTSAVLLQSIGTVIMYAMGGYMDYYLVLWVVIWLPILNLVALLIIPESPAFLVKKGKVEEATKVMAWLRGVNEDEKEVERDISIIRDEVLAYENLPPVTWKSILSKRVTRRGLALAFLLMTLLDLGGNYAILAYASVILKNAGVIFAPKLQALAFPSLMTLGSILSAVTVEKFGRKPLIMTSAIFTGGPLAVLGAMMLVQQNGGYMPLWLPVVCIGVCLCASGLYLALPFVVMSEIFSIQLRTKMLSVLVMYGWSACAIQMVLFSSITEHFGMHTLFLGFAFINAIGVVICFIYLPETKGKTQAQLEKEIEGTRK